MRALSEVVKSGKARFIGFSEWSPDQIEAALKLSKERGFGEVRLQPAAIFAAAIAARRRR